MLNTNLGTSSSLVLPTPQSQTEKKRNKEDTKIIFEYLSDKGYIVIPTGGEDGKRPLIRFKNRTQPLKWKQIEKLWEKQPDGFNLAFLTGSKNNLMVVDCDIPSEEVITYIKREFGETSLVIKTPRGGFHYYYQYSGENCKVKVISGIDIRAEGGIILIPPSYNPKHNAYYEVYEGSFTQISDLPKAKENNPALQLQLVSKPTSKTQKKKQIPCVATDQQATFIYGTDTLEGNRDNSLFYALKDYLCTTSDTEESLFDKAWSYNNQYMHPPLDEQVVRHKVQHILEMRDNGTLIKKGSNSYWCSGVVFETLTKHHLALTIMLYLTRNHSKRTENFYISQVSLAPTFGVDRRKIGKACKTLEEVGFITKTYKKKLGDKLLQYYTWGSKMI